MGTSYGALCSDFYINSKLTLKMDLPEDRQTVLDLFDRVRKEHPPMSRFKRYRGELSLESAEQAGSYDWLALRKTTIRAGTVNPHCLDKAYEIHKAGLRLAPFYLGLSPLDIEGMEVLFGFDFEAHGNHHQIVADALMAGSPVAKFFEGALPVDAQPFAGIALTEDAQTQAFFEVKARTNPAQAQAGEGGEDPLSVYLTVRRNGPFDSVDALPDACRSLCANAEAILEDKLLPIIIQPLREAISSRRF